MQELYRMIPKVDLFLQKTQIQALIQEYGRCAVTEAVRQVQEELRRQAGALENGAGKDGLPEETAFLRAVEKMPERVREILRERQMGRFHHVINATGTVLHTNLGRAPLSEEQALRLAKKLQGYSNLEYDLRAGKRGERYSHFEELLTELTGAEAAVAVNNNAAAVLLVLSALAAGKEVIVSRGEQIEIGGKFRIPEVIEQGGAILREVGTTNKTHREDYVRAVNENTGAILKVHTSNYWIQGFTESVPVEELTGLGVPVIQDLGSGVLVNLEEFGLEHEPTVQESVRHGADVVCFSGDKLLGGPQAGIIVGRKELIRRIKAHPLMRAVRIDKFTAAALELTLLEYERHREEVSQRIPVLRMMKQTRPQLRARAEALRELVLERMAGVGDDAAGAGVGADGMNGMQGDVEADGLKRMQADVSAGWRLEVLDCVSEAGGGSLPGQELPSCALVLSPVRGELPGAGRLQEMLRFQNTPVIGRVAREKLWLDVRTVFEEEMETLAEELAEILKGAGKEAGRA